MYLGGQDGQRGYAMAACLVAIAVMGVVMSALLPVWRHQAQREKEAELLFRMQQYALAIDLYRAKNNNLYPPSIDALVQGRYLRKKYKDPMTDDDFQPLFQGQQPGTGGGRGQGAPQAGGIVGVVSKSKETAIRNQRGATTYNQWQVTAADAPPGPGYPVGRGNRGAGPGVPGGPAGGRGNVPPGGRGVQPGLGGPGRGAPPFGPGVGAPGRGGPGRGSGEFPGGRGRGGE